MGAVNLGVTYGRNDLAETPRVQIQNVLLEQNATNEIDNKSWLIRPGVATFFSPESGHLRGVMQSTSSYPGKVFFVMGTSFYREDTTTNAYAVLGAVNGNDTAIFAYHNADILVCADGAVHLYDGTNFNFVPMPSGQDVAWVAYLAGYFLFGLSNSQQIFFMADNATEPAALDFFSAETHSTDTVRAMVLNDQLVIFCEENTEFWQPSGDPDLPFSRIVGTGYEKGLASPQGVVAIDNTLMFVGNDLVVYRAESIPLRVSTNTIEELIRLAEVANGDAAVLQSWAYLADGHAYFVLTIDGQGTYPFDVSTGSWLQWLSGVSAYWLTTYGATLSSNLTLGGNSFDTSIYKVSPDLGTDVGLPIDWILTGGVQILGPSQRLDSLTLMTSAGYGGTLTEPVTVNLRISNDQGNTWAGPFNRSNGVPGDFAAVPTWRMMGQMKQPQCVLEFSGSVNSPFRISYARFNESFAP